MARSLITADIGNSCIKVGFFDTLNPTAVPRPRQVYRIATDKIEGLHQHLADADYHWQIGSVHSEFLLSFTDWLVQDRPQDTFHVVTHRDLDLMMDVDAPELVGIDRLAAAATVNQLRKPALAALAIDVGTTITLDVVSPAGVFLGGAIAPGLSMRLDAMHRGTDKLPPVSVAVRTPPYIGKNTEAAMQAGAFWSVITQIEGTVSRLKGAYGHDLMTFLTGGSADMIVGQLDVEIHHEPSLVLSGLALAQS